MTSRRGVLATAFFSVLALSLSGCVSWFLPTPPTTVSTPTGEEVSAELAPFYSQVLEWESCRSNMQCATAAAPLDWRNPAEGEIELSLVRQVAQGERLGSLLVNPGGPGASGVDFVADSVDFATSDRLQQHFDVVGFDPRGVNRSSAVSCYDDPETLDRYLYEIPDAPVGSDEYIASLLRSSTEFGEACLEHTGPLLEFVDTVSAARDLDLVRAILGDERLNYLGYSYGSLLGATYAELYPEKTGRLVLDGAIDPATSNFEVTATQARGFENAMRAFLADCLTASECPFDGTVDQAMSDIRALLDSLDASPLRGSDGRELGSSTMFTAIILPLYNRDTWQYLYDLFDQVMQGESETAFLLADSYNERSPDGTFLSNSTEAFIAINCLDYKNNDTVESIKADAERMRQIAPTFGPQMSYGGSGCAGWPFPGTRDREPITAEGAADILVVGTTNDPATPYQWAVNLSEQLESGHLLSYEGEGHTAYNKSNDCVNDVVDDYLVEGAVPETDPRC